MINDKIPNPSTTISIRYCPECNRTDSFNQLSIYNKHYSRGIYAQARS